VRAVVGVWRGEVGRQAGWFGALPEEGGLFGAHAAGPLSTSSAANAVPGEGRSAEARHRGFDDGSYGTHSVGHPDLGQFLSTTPPQGPASWGDCSKMRRGRLNVRRTPFKIETRAWAIAASGARGRWPSSASSHRWKRGPSSKSKARGGRGRSSYCVPRLARGRSCYWGGWRQERPSNRSRRRRPWRFPAGCYGARVTTLPCECGAIPWWRRGSSTAIWWWSAARPRRRRVRRWWHWWTAWRR
jgi:hypothetical protein